VVPKFLELYSAWVGVAVPKGSAQLIESDKVHFMGVVKLPKVNIPSNFIKFVGKVNNQGTHKLPNKSLINGFLQCHKVFPNKIIQQNQ